MNFQRLDTMLKDGVENGVFPCAAAAVGHKNEIYYQKIIGSREKVPKEKPASSDTLFDIASLTKILSTTMLALLAIEQGELSLYDSLSRFYRNAGDKGEITVLQLMTHQSGLPAHAPLWQMGITPDQAENTILHLPLAYQTGSQVAYSCMGYILLGKILENLFAGSLDRLAHDLVFSRLGMNHTGYLPTSENIAATEYQEDAVYCCQGIVHDENARFLGGVSGNAGVFSPLNDIIQFAAMLSNKGGDFLSSRAFSLATTDYTAFDPYESRGLGFQLYTGKSTPCGDLFSPMSFGHTGFTGTSLYIDHDTGLFVILLTNRVHPTRTNEKLLRFRRVFHNAVWGCFSNEDINKMKSVNKS